MHPFNRSWFISVQDDLQSSPAPPPALSLSPPLTTTFNFQGPSRLPHPPCILVHQHKVPDRLLASLSCCLFYSSHLYSSTLTSYSSTSITDNPNNPNLLSTFSSLLTSPVFTCPPSFRLFTSRAYKRHKRHLYEYGVLGLSSSNLLPSPTSYPPSHGN